MDQYYQPDSVSAAKVLEDPLVTNFCGNHSHKLSIYDDTLYQLADPISTNTTKLLGEQSLVTLHTNGSLTFGEINDEVGDWFYIETMAYLDTYPEHTQVTGWMYFEMVDSCLYTQVYPLKLKTSEDQFKVPDIDYNNVTSIFKSWFPTDKSTFGH